MEQIVLDLYSHQEWADAKHWGAIVSPEALADQELRNRLHHLHVIQRAFLKMFRGESLDLKAELSNIPALSDIKSSAMQYHAEVKEFLANVTGDDLSRPILIPFFPGNFSPSMRDAAIQAVTHSTYHRGQNAARLKQLGITPPNTDYIVWVYKGRTPAKWTG